VLELVANCLNHLRLLPESARVVCWLQLFSVLQSTGFYPAVQVSWAPQSAPRNSRTKIMLMMPCYSLTTLLSGRTSYQASMKLQCCTYDGAEYWTELLLENSSHEAKERNTSWSKTKIQNLGHGVTPTLVQLQGHVVESTDRFTYLGSDIHSSKRSTPEILRRINLVSNIFGRLANVWKRTGLSLQCIPRPVVRSEWGTCLTPQSLRFGGQMTFELTLLENFFSKICVSITIHIPRPNLAKIGRCELA